MMIIIDDEFGLRKHTVTLWMAFLRKGDTAGVQRINAVPQSGVGNVGMAVQENISRAEPRHMRRAVDMTVCDEQSSGSQHETVVCGVIGKFQHQSVHFRFAVSPDRKNTLGISSYGTSGQDGQHSLCSKPQSDHEPVAGRKAFQPQAWSQCLLWTKIILTI